MLGGCFALFSWATDYYSQSSSALAVGNFNANPGGGGATPANFTTAGDVFHIQNGHAMTLGSTLTIGSSSNNTKLIIENGGSLTCTSALSMGSASTLQIDDGGSYTHSHSGAFSSLFAGTEVFAAGSNFIIGGSASPGTGPSTASFSGSFGNFTLAGTSTTTMQCNDVFPNVAGNFTHNGAMEFRMAGGVAGNGGFTISKDFTINSGIFSFGNGTQAPNLTLYGNFSLAGTAAFQTANTSSGTCTIFFSKPGGGVQTFSKSSTSNIIAASSSNRRIVFSVSSGVTFDMGTQILNAASSTNLDFNLTSGATLRIGDPGGIVATGTTATTGNIQTSSTSLRTFSTGANYEYTGTTQVSGTGLPATINKLVVGSSVGLTLESDLSVTTSLTIPGASLKISPGAGLTIPAASTAAFADKPVRLLSDAMATARIGQVGGNITGATKVTLERYIPGGRRAYRYLGHPFGDTTTLTQLQDNIDVTGAGGSANGFVPTGTNAPSAYFFAPTSTTGTDSAGQAAGWQAFSNITKAWKTSQGIAVFVRGAKGQGLDGNPYTPLAVTLDVAGTVNVGPVVVQLTKAPNQISIS